MKRLTKSEEMSISTREFVEKLKLQNEELEVRLDELSRGGSEVSNYNGIAENDFKPSSNSTSFLPELKNTRVSFSPIPKRIHVEPCLIGMSTTRDDAGSSTVSQGLSCFCSHEQGSSTRHFPSRSSSESQAVQLAGRDSGTVRSKSVCSLVDSVLRNVDRFSQRSFDLGSENAKLSSTVRALEAEFVVLQSERNVVHLLAQSREISLLKVLEVNQRETILNFEVHARAVLRWAWDEACALVAALNGSKVREQAFVTVVKKLTTPVDLAAANSPSQLTKEFSDNRGLRFPNNSHKTNIKYSQSGGLLTRIPKMNSMKRIPLMEREQRKPSHLLPGNSDEVKRVMFAASKASGVEPSFLEKL